MKGGIAMFTGKGYEWGMPVKDWWWRMFTKDD